MKGSNNPETSEARLARLARVDRLRDQYAAELCRPAVKPWKRPVYSSAGDRVASIAEAARLLGVHRCTLASAVRRGSVAKGRLWAFEGCPLPEQPPAAIVDTSGHAYRSARDAARQLGCSDQTILRRLKSGRPINGRIIHPGPDWGSGKGRWSRSRVGAGRDGHAATTL